MSENKLTFGLVRSCLLISSKIGIPRTLSTLVYFFSFFLFFSSSVMAQGEAAVGVVKSQDNARQWSEITNRLQRTGVNYCTIDASNWQNELDFGNINVLFLPNVETLNGSQAIALERWMGRGGKVIVTGPTGDRSQQEVRNKLRSLFGAYWGFSLSSPSTLSASANALDWIGSQKLESTFVGGAVIPSGIQSQTAAVWQADGKPPAVVVTNNSTFLGWRWGVNEVTTPSLDAAWLQVVLNRYGISNYGQIADRTSNPSACNTNPKSSDENRPFLPNWQSLQLEEDRPTSSTWQFNLVLPNQSGSIDPRQLDSMNRELDGLISRFETTLLAADSASSEVETSTTKAIEKSSDFQNKGNKSLSLKSSSTRAHQVLEEAIEQQEQFRQSIAQGDYNRAREVWMQARRMLWDHYPTDRQVAQPEIRSMWLDRGTIVKARSEADLAELFDRMAVAGINTVFFETLNASYPIYPSKVAPEQNPLTVGWDPLQAAVKLAHERNMELHAWVWVFAAANQRHNLKLNQPQDYLGPILSRHRDWAMTDNQGNIFEKTAAPKAFFDPANPGVKNYLTSLIEEIATNYQVDGIQLDYIRYPFQNPNYNQTYGYGVAARQQFKSLTGVDPMSLSPRDPLWIQWNQFRTKQVDDFVASISQKLKAKRPELVISAAVFPIPKYERLAKLQQNWEEWLDQEWIDLLVPMTYAQDTTQFEQMTQPLFREPQASSTLILPGIRLLNLPDVVTIDQLQMLRNSSAGGYALFAAENFDPDLEEIFSRTQGSPKSTQKQLLPHRQPLEASALRFLSLQKEWNYLIANDRLRMERMTMRDWGKQVDRLALSFDKLIDEPTLHNLYTTQLELSSFRRRFPIWMEAEKQNKPYQVQAWENRLASLDRLLSYGERVVFAKQSSSTSIK